MSWKTVGILTILGAPAMQVDDTQSEGYETLQACYYRGAEMILSIIQRSPVVMANTFCLQIQKKVSL